MTDQAIVVMGVAGAGKSTIGRLLSERIGAVFVDADDLHPAANKAKMIQGIPLDDADRKPWLQAVAQRIDEETVGERTVVVACSALKRSYRDALRANVGVPITVVHLDGHEALLADRLGRREGHFTPAALLASQLATLEPLDSDEHGVVISIDEDVDEIIARAVLEVHR